MKRSKARAHDSVRSNNIFCSAGTIKKKPNIADEKIQAFLQSAATHTTQEQLRSRLSSSSVSLLPYHTRETQSKPSANKQNPATVSETPPLDEEARATSAITVPEFVQKYCRYDPILTYAIDVIQTRSPVRRSDIPKGKNAKRVIVREDDVLYLIYDRVPPCGFKNVYWLEFSTEEYVLDGVDEYFTLSSHGFTHFRHGVVIEYADAGVWIDEKRAFDHMTNMKGLQKIQQMLFFFSWKKKAIKNRHRRVRAFLECKLFQCDSVATRILVKIQALCVKLEEADVVKEIKDFSTYSTACYAVRQDAALEKTRTTVSKVLASICETIHRHTTRTATRSRVTVQYITSALHLQPKPSSLRERMFCFLRLVDLLVSEAMFKHLSMVVTDIHSRICGPLLMDAAKPTKPRCTTLVLNQISDQQVDFSIRFHLRDKHAPWPLLYTDLQESTHPEATECDDATSFDVRPNKTELLQLIHLRLMEYIKALDEMPRVLQDQQFQDVLTPFAPYQRQSFVESLNKHSSIVFREHSYKLKEMRQAIDVYFKHVEMLMGENMRFLNEVQRANKVRSETQYFQEVEDQQSDMSATSAERYENEQRLWEKFLTKVQSMTPYVQIGCVLINQQPLVEKLQRHIAIQIEQLDQLLPVIYKQFLQTMLTDVESRLEQTTTIPTDIEGAMKWLHLMMEMLPNHPFRVLFDGKCKNIEKLKLLLKERATKASISQGDDHDAVRKMEFAWESLHETFLMCLDRVQRRDGEHRQSFQDLASKMADQIANQLEEARNAFETVPTGMDLDFTDKKKIREMERQKKEIIEHLEQVVEVDVEREQVVALFAEYESRHRQIEEDPTSLVAARPIRASSDKKLLSETFLQYVVTAFDLRKWFLSWRELEHRWITSPLCTVHSSAVMNRIKQSRRRSRYASSTLSTGHQMSLADTSFTVQDLNQLKAFELSIEEMAENCRIFQAFSSGAFTDERWAMAQQHFASDPIQVWHHQSRDQITLEQLQRHWAQCPDQKPLFMELCDRSIVEAKIHVKTEQIRMRVNQLRVEFRQENYRIRLLNIKDVLRDLEDASMELQLMATHHNPEVESLMTLLQDVEIKKKTCAELAAFQSQWFLLCEMTKLHDVEEFFSGQSPMKSRKARKTTTKCDDVWIDFVATSTIWSDRIRRLSCMMMNESGSLETTAKDKLECPLEPVVESFRGFEFDKHIKHCEDAVALCRSYLQSLRHKVPRLYLLNDTELLRLMTREEDLEEIKHALLVCFPHVHRFVIAHGLPHDRESQELAVTSNRQSTQVVISGIADRQDTSFPFNMEVLKIGRIKFWISRIEEELGNLVRDHLKKALLCVLYDDAELKRTVLQQRTFGSLLPQCMLLAFIVRFKFEVGHGCPDLLNHNGGDGADRMVQIDELLMRKQRWQSELMEFMTNPVNGFVKRDSRLESLMLLTLHQLSNVRHFKQLWSQQKHEDAMMHCQMQLFVHIHLENATMSVTRTTKMPNASLPDVQSAVQAHAVQLVAQVAHMQLPVGSEFVGWERLPIVAPITDRCTFALFAAMRTHSAALVVPYTSGASPSSTSVHLIQAMAHVLMKLTFVIDCAAQIESLSILENHVVAAFSLNCFMVFERVLSLSSALCGVFHERIVAMYHESIVRQPPIVSSVSQRGPAQSSVVFFPLRQSELNASRVLLPLQTSWRPVAVVMPSMDHLVDALLLLEGYTAAQIDLMQLRPFLMDLCTHLSVAIDPFVITQKIVAEAMILKRTTVITSIAAEAKKNKRKGKRLSMFRSQQASAQSFDAGMEQTIFSTAAHRVINAVLDSSGQSMLSTLCFKYFAAAQQYDVTDKSIAKGDTMVDAVQICLEHSGLAVNDRQLTKIMQLYQALDHRQSCLVYGEGGCGKTTCIKTLHKALSAVEFTEEDTTNTSSSAMLVILNHHLMTYDDLFGLETDHSQPPMFAGLIPQLLCEKGGQVAAQQPQRLWLYFDGLPASLVVQPLVSMLQAQYDRLQLANTVMATANPAFDVRVVMEATGLKDVSPDLLMQCSTIYIEPTCLQHQDVVTAWKSSWCQYPVESPSVENAELVQRTLAFFIHELCVPFVRDDPDIRTALENGQLNEQEPGNWRLGGLSVLRMVQNTLNLVSVLLLQQRAALEELSGPEISKVLLFCTLWGFAGHLNDTQKQKLDHFIRARVQNRVELRHLADVQGNSFDVNRLREVWGQFHGSIQSPDVVFDPLVSHFVLVPPSAATLIRISRLLMHQMQSFVICGNRGSGKTSLLRVLSLLNEEELANEAMIEASIGSKHCQEILNWQHMSSGFFKPSINASSASFLRTEDALLSPSGRHAFVFLDDVGVDDSQVEFVRHVVNHRVLWSRRHHRVVAIDKHFGLTTSLSEEVTEWSDSMVRMLRHVMVLRLGGLDRKELQSIFRQKYQLYFQKASTQSSSSTTNSTGDRVLSTEETILRSNVDFAQEMMGISGLLPNFAFNLHHLDELMRRTFCCGMDAQSPVDTSLFALGKLHQAWLAEARNVTTIPYPKPTENEEDDVSKQIWSCLRIVSDKYYSVALRADVETLLSSSVAFFAHAILSRKPAFAEQKIVAQLREILVGKASTMSLIRSQATPKDEGSSSHQMDRLIVQTLFQVAKAQEDLALSLLLANRSWLDRLLHLLHAMDHRKHMMVTTRDIDSTRTLVEFASRVHGVAFRLLGCDINHQDVLQEALELAVIQQQRVMLWVPVESLIPSWVIDICMHKLPHVVLYDSRLRDAMAAAVVNNLEKLEVLDDQQVLDRIRQLIVWNLQICVCTSSSLASMTPLDQLPLVQCFVYENDRSVECGLMEMVHEAILQSKLSLLDAPTLEQLPTTLVKIHEQFFQKNVHRTHTMAFLQLLKAIVTLSNAKETHLSSISTTKAMALSRLRQKSKVVTELHEEQVRLKRRIDAHRERCGYLNALLDQLPPYLVLEEAEEEDDEVRLMKTAAYEHERWAVRALVEENELELDELRQLLVDVGQDLAEWEAASAAIMALDQTWTNELKQLDAQTKRLQQLAILQSIDLVYWTTLSVDERSKERSQLLSSVSPVDLMHEVSTGFKDEETPPVIEIWQMRFPYLETSSLYDHLLMADYVIDQIPVLVDPTGLVQRLLVLCLSGRLLTSEEPDHNVLETFGSDSLVVVSGTDPTLASKLALAHQRNLPFVLLDADADCLHQLNDLLVENPAYQVKERKPLLYDLTLHSFEIYKAFRSSRKSLAQKQKRKILSSVVYPNGIASVAKNHLTTTKSKASEPKTRSASAAVVSKPAASVPQQKHLGFQIYAASMQPIGQNLPVASFVQVEWTASELIGLFRDVWMKKTQPKLQQELDDVAFDLISQSLAMNSLRQQTQAGLFTTHSLATLADHVTQWFQEQRKHRSQRFLLQQRRQEMEKQVGSFSFVGETFFDLMQSLEIVSRAFALESKSVRWLASELAMQLIDTQSSIDQVDTNQLLESVLQNVLHRICMGFTDPAVRQTLEVLLALKRGIRRHHLTFKSDRVFEQTIELLSKSPLDFLSMATIKTKDKTQNEEESTTVPETTEAEVKTTEAETTTIPATPASEITTTATSSSSSLVERLRRKIRSCAHFFHQLEALRATATDKPKATTTSTTASRASIMGGTRVDMTHRQTPSVASTALQKLREPLESDVTSLQKELERLWNEYKWSCHHLQTQLQELLTSIGIVHYASGMKHTKKTTSDFIHSIQRRTQSTCEQEYLATTDSSSAFTTAVTRVVITKLWYPDAVVQSAMQLIDHTPTSTRSSEAPCKPHVYLDLAFASDGIVHLPSCVMAYEPLERHVIEVMVSEPLLTVYELNPNEFKDAVTAMVTTQPSFLIEILHARDFDPVVSVVSRVINQHALLSAPTWRLICPQHVLQSVPSGRLPFTLISRAYDNYNVIEMLQKHLEQKAVSDVVVSRFLGRYERLWTNELRDRLPVVPVMQHLIQSANELHGSDLTFTQSEALQTTVAIAAADACFTCSNDEEAKITTDGRSASLLNALHRLQPRDLSLPPAFLNQFSRLESVYHHLQQLDADQRTLCFSEALFVPWRSLHQEFEQQVQVIKILSSHVHTLQRMLYQSQCPPSYLDQVRTLQRGLVPLVWTQALHLHGLLWPAISGTISFVQLLVLLYCRLRLLTSSLCLKCPWALNLAAVSDVRGFLGALQTFYSSKTQAPVVHLMIELEDTASTSVMGTDWLHPAVIVDSNHLVCGLRVEGLVLQEQFIANTRPRTMLHVLPVCRLTCVVPSESEAKDDRLAQPMPLVLLPSISIHLPASSAADTVVYEHMILGSQLQTTLMAIVSDSISSLCVGLPFFPEEEEEDTSVY